MVVVCMLYVVGGSDMSLEPNTHNISVDTSSETGASQLVLTICRSAGDNDAEFGRYAVLVLSFNFRKARKSKGSGYGAHEGHRVDRVMGSAHRRAVSHISSWTQLQCRQQVREPSVFSELPIKQARVQVVSHVGVAEIGETYSQWGAASSNSSQAR